MGRDDTGVSTVMGGILFLALLSVFLVTVRVEYVPVWEEEREARHMEKVQGHLSTIQTDLGRQVGNSTQNAIAHSLSLGAGSGSRFFAAPALPASLTFSANTAPVTFSSNEFRVLFQDGQSTLGFDEQWVNLTDGTVGNVSEVLHFRVRIADPVGEGGGPAPDANTTLTVRGDDGAFVGRIIFASRAGAANDFLDITVEDDEDPDTAPVYFRSIAYQRSSKPDWFFANLLSDELGFAPLLRAAEKPLDVVLDENGMTAEYTISYIESTDEGKETLVGSTGKTLTDYAKTVAAGRLTATYDNRYFPSQAYVMEGGGVVLVQGDDAVMRMEPLLTARVVDGTTALGVTVAGLAGPSDTVSGVGTATLTAHGRATTSQVGTAPHWGIEVATGHPGAWAQAWRDILQRAGLDEAGGEFAVTTTPSTAALVVYGTVGPGDADSTEHDLNIRLAYGTIGIRIST